MNNEKLTVVKANLLFTYKQREAFREYISGSDISVTGENLEDFLSLLEKEEPRGKIIIFLPHKKELIYYNNGELRREVININQ